MIYFFYDMLNKHGFGKETEFEVDLEYIVNPGLTPNTPHYNIIGWTVSKIKTPYNEIINWSTLSPEKAEEINKWIVERAESGSDYLWGMQNASKLSK